MLLDHDLHEAKWDLNDHQIELLESQILRQNMLVHDQIPDQHAIQLPILHHQFYEITKQIIQEGHPSRDHFSFKSKN